ncbi:DUF5336 domain-containing protein [Streptomyces somaliensis DSM 40738]|uniref:Uncharacterized protein n=1 Tax=Streptomyces somaliensis (strain ATCC 33201 / DSM 40738 / JCM 12659 / KCTC 9044 / NCTC 11332 / NRRL B-12077 / IP 733) TaxID=1134445 RepID=A0AA44IDP7_STRE0|nr:DUF5336 domain-containing protein [Streptomyces somaliensis]MCQ0022540.1 DUF5336 domain-containing protein [Streptomyces somaliensis DSM 40738]NKY14722.1 hypothetical protein [Streptomyces somaliensis DSM 40738]
MNIRSLTRGDGVVIGAAVVLFIASFLSLSSVDCPAGIDCSNYDTPNAWDMLGLLMSMFLAGVIGAALIVVARAMPGRRVAGLDLGQFGVAFTVFALWTALWTIIDAHSAGAGMILGLLAALVLAAAAVASPLVPALKAPLVSAPRPQAPQPYGGQPGVTGGTGYGYPGGQPFGGQPSGTGGYGYPAGGQPQPGPVDLGQPQPEQHGVPAAAQQGAPAGDFAPFWFAVPVARPLYAEDGSPTPVAELAPGTWYLAVEQRGAALVAQTQDGRRGVLQDTTGIQRG